MQFRVVSCVAILICLQNVCVNTMRQYQCLEIAAFVEVLRLAPASVVLWLPSKALNAVPETLRPPLHFPPGNR